LRARLAIWIIGGFALGNAAQSLNIRLEKSFAEIASVMRTRRSDFEGLPAESNFVLKNRVARICGVF
jgi:hypothetical protein